MEDEMKIMVRYGEIGLKSDQVRKKFEQKLMENLRKKIHGKVVKENNRIFVEVPGKIVSDQTLVLRKTPGIVSVSPCLEASSETDEIYEKIKDILEDYVEDIGSFALETRRVGGQEYTSQELAEELGQKVVDKFGLDVDLEEPDLRVYIEVRNNKSYVYTEKVDCIGGLPIGIEGRVLLLLEDKASVVSGVLMMKRGCEVVPLYTGEDTEKIEVPMSILRSFDPDIKLLRGDIEENSDLKKTAEVMDCKALVTGSTSEDIKEGKRFEDLEIPVLTPNCAMSEEEVLEKYAEFRF